MCLYVEHASVLMSVSRRRVSLCVFVARLIYKVERGYFVMVALFTPSDPSLSYCGRRRHDDTIQMQLHFPPSLLPNNRINDPLRPQPATGTGVSLRWFDLSHSLFDVGAWPPCSHLR